MNRFDVHELYDLEAFQETEKSLRMTCNLFMHSYFLWMIYDLDGHAEGEGTIASVHLTSDFEKENAIYQFEIAELLRVFRSVAEDELAVFKLGRNPSTGEWKIEEK